MPEEHDYPAVCLFIKKKKKKKSSFLPHSNILGRVPLKYKENRRNGPLMPSFQECLIVFFSLTTNYVGYLLTKINDALILCPQISTFAVCHLH